MRRRSEATRPLEAVQIDHAIVDAIVMDEDGVRELGRPWITLGVDLFTRMATGFHVALAPPTRLSTSLCLLHSVCDKTLWLAERGVGHEWPAAGLPERLHLDCDSFFGRRAFVRACREIGVETVWRAPSGARYGAHIEALIGNRLGRLPLVTGIGPIERVGLCDRISPHPPRLTLRELESRLGHEIAGVYNCRRHRDLGRAPLTLWRRHAETRSRRMPLDCVAFRMALLPDDEGALGEEGLRLFGRVYRSRALADDFASGLARLEVRYDPRDLSRVFVRRPSGRFAKAREFISLSPPGAPLPAFSEDEIGSPRTARASPFGDELPRGGETFSAHDAGQDAGARCAGKCVGSCPFPLADR